ncbi:MAG: large-conductance mechanosensitive channel protein MscL [Gammaproteobacteria bacterium]|nr:large-conductance mechanosensitive channel protein MscL [Gammaproteobacteria bacterium]
MSILKEFREFAMRGNVIDLAVGVVIGAAFGKIVSSLVGDVMMPLLGKAAGSVSFDQLVTSLGVGPDGSEIILKWGAFLQTLFDFTIIAMALFLAIKAINRLKRPEPATPVAAPPPPRSERLLEEIRDLLQQR